MNSHSEIQKRLAAYSSGDIDAGEQAEIEAHLASCLRCRADLADLKTTLKLIRSVPEVEALSWMKSRIMAHLREEQAAKRSWLQRFRFSLNTGFPVKALALLIVCVSGYYLTRSVDTELQQAQQQHVKEIPALQVPTPASIPAAAPAPAQTQTGRENAERPAPQQAQKTTAPVSAPQPSPGQETLPARIHSAPAPGSYTTPPPALKDQYGGKSETLKAAPAAESSSRVEAAPEMKLMNKSRSLERSSDVAAPAAMERASGAPVGLALTPVVVRLQVNDPATAAALIRKAVARSAGSIMEEQAPAGHRLTIRISANRQSELLERLQELGRILERPAPPPAGAQLLVLTILW